VEVTDVWARSCVAWAAGPCRTGETTLAAHLEPAYGPGDLVSAYSFCCRMAYDLM